MQGALWVPMHHNVVHAVLVSMAYMENGACLPAAQLPWSLAQCDVQENLRGLRSGPDADGGGLPGPGTDQEASGKTLMMLSTTLMRLSKVSCC